MAKEKPIMIPLEKIENRFDVRVKLDEDRVVQLAGCYEGGIDLPPVKVTPIGDGGYAYVDGRHRGAAREYCGFKDVAAIVVDNPNDPAELFAQALEANWGGSKPPTRDDIDHTITRMLELKATQTAIRERLSFLPAGSLKAYIYSARGHLTRRRIAKALDAIADGAKVEEAANKFIVPIDMLKEVLSGKRGKWAKGRSSEDELAASLKAYISQQLFSANAGIGKKMEGLLSKVEDGEVSYRAAYGVIRAWSEHLRKTGIRVADWRARLNAISGEADKAVTEEKRADAPGSV